jgi:hypothetical protein
MPPKPPKKAARPPTGASVVPPVSAQLAALIREDPRTPIDIARDAGLAPSVVSRFLLGERALSLGSLDRISAALGGVRLVRVRPARKGSRGG